ncbi:hypothetical protein L198_05215 [Cryptococcus wingfieldii CBS 7118]|uniref:Zn(2)-C6 fungal-type domain-containing protein n=1 Tax=Cryptococcus wingfieldii CBS 7118 TaxID=1295528 RepID=A0A1E3J2L3_9TREE|nr:hypothetical protein L198_05215 [Cryptococcus wingfieldii CBS 7118]ODN94356.1 hypothetical protein L198_05215 [Cryptococcus wingfieldii CBS 7118]
MSGNCGFVLLIPVSQALADSLFLSSALPGFPSPSPNTYTTTYTTTNNTTSSDGNAPEAQLYDSSGIFPVSYDLSTVPCAVIGRDLNALGIQLSGHSGAFPASYTPSTINYTSSTQLSPVTPSPASSGDKAKPKARSSVHATNTRSIKASGKEKKKHAEGYKRKSMSCEHCKQRRKECDGTDFNACTRCTCDGIECKYVLAKGKRGSQKALKKLAAMGRAPSADGVYIATPSTSSLASSSGTSSMSPITPITPITPARSAVELSSGPSPASVSAGLTSGFATPHIFMPFVPPAQLPVAVGANGMLKDHPVVEMQQALFDNEFDSCCSVLAAAPASKAAARYHPPTPRTTPVKPTYVRPTDVSPVQAPTFSLLNASVLSTLPAMDVTQPQPQLPAFDPQTLSESERLEWEKLAMDSVFGNGSFSAPPEAPCEAAPVALLPTPDTTPVKPTAEMSAISPPADPTTINISYADFSEPQPTLWVSAPQTQAGDEAVPEDEEDVDWGMYVNMEEMEEVDDGGSLGAVIESSFSTRSFEFNTRPFEATDRDMRGLWG